MELKEKTVTECDCGGSGSRAVNETVAEIVSAIGREKDKVIPILQEVQKRLNYIPSEALRQICSLTEITPEQISGVSTFYSQFRHLPAGKHTIRICQGTACHVKGANLVSDAFRRVLKLEGEATTTADRLFSVEEVACLGCCTLAPVVQIDDKTYGHVSPTSTEEIIADFLHHASKGTSGTDFINKGDQKTEIRIGLGSCCVAGGSKEILSEIISVRDRYNLEVSLKPVGCVGVCNQTPLMEIVNDGLSSSRYTNVKKEQVEDIILEHVKPASAGKRLSTRINDLVDTFVTDSKLMSPVYKPAVQREKVLNDFLEKQLHLATEMSGNISPVSLDEYLLFDGFSAFDKCLKENIKATITETIKRSGLRGRGGAGFPTGIKWEYFSAARGESSYVVCNGDEGDPGAFMDRMLLESFPFRIIEGMMIAAVATGATDGIFYIRAEYPLAVSRIRNALKQCREAGLLGRNIKNSGFSFDISIFEGAGAFVCGEETALISSMEGRRGLPHIRPPYPVEKGFKGSPTLVNNVETLSLVPWIINHGADAFSSVGTLKSKGTKVFALAGKVLRGGLIEVPMGTTIRDIVEGIGKGVAPGRKFKAVQIGGPSGGCIPESLADTPVDYEELTGLGAMMGSGGLVVLDDSDCMVDMARYFLSFTHKQSCGKCTFCRIGTKKMLDILDRLAGGKASAGELSELDDLCWSVTEGSLCGLGKTAPNPVITGLKYFREEYEEHARGHCRAKRCTALVRYHVSEKCTGCTKCSQGCPVKAIPFTPYSRHEIDQALCTKCDNCRVICPEKAIEIVNVND
ncbi:MAG TPA: NAD(P)H-dependent oxidoreductase subunit E [Bacteroidales bacterium]|nr:NAD(P)H-dependent oxidoreductase subunit E [Bacteroidales bacterium]